MLSPTQSEFEAFPPTLQRKCFSTLERLRYAQAARTHAQQSATAPSTPVNQHHSTRNATIKDRRPSAPSARRPRRPTIAPPGFLTRSPVGKRKSRIGEKGRPLTTADISREDALWFSKLPEKVRRGQFTVEEQHLLAGRQGTPPPPTVLPDAADELFNKLRQARSQCVPYPNRSLPSLDSTHSSDTEEVHSDRDSPVTVTDDDMDAELMESFRWFDSDDHPLDLALDDYHVHVAATAERSKAPTHRKPTYRRSRPGAGAALPLDSPLSPDLQQAFSRSAIQEWGSGWGPAPKTSPCQSPTNFSRSAAGATGRTLVNAERTMPSLPAVSPSVLATNANHPVKKATPPNARRPSLEANAAHYLNPEARLKLRLYLSTPAKFDEALEFGFPALNSGSASNPVQTASFKSASRRPVTARQSSAPLTKQVPATRLLSPSPDPEPQSQAPPQRPKAGHRRSRSLGSITQLLLGPGARTFLDETTNTTSSTSTVSAFFCSRTNSGDDPLSRLDLSPSLPPLNSQRSLSSVPAPRHAKEASVSSLSSPSEAASKDTTAAIVPPYYRHLAPSQPEASVSSLQPSTAAPSDPNGPAVAPSDGEPPRFDSLSSAPTPSEGAGVVEDAEDAALDGPSAPARPLQAYSPLRLDSDPLAGREMTLRMTLTRPDLREANVDAASAPRYIGPGAHAAGARETPNLPSVRRGPSLKERVGKSFGLGGDETRDEGSGLRRFLTRRW